MNIKSCRLSVGLLRINMIILAVVTALQLALAIVILCLPSTVDSALNFIRIVSLAIIIAAIAASVINLIGYILGLRADRYFLAALLISLLPIIVMVINIFLDDTSAAASILDTVSGFSGTLALIFAVFALIRVSGTLGDGEAEHSGNLLLSQIALLLFLSVTFSMIASLNLGASTVPNTVFSIASDAVSVLLYVILAVYFSKIRKLLKKQPK